MARLPRLNLPNVPQHIVQRGNSRQVTFVESDDYVIYLEKLKYYATEYEVNGNDKFKQQVEEMSGRRASPLPKGGDRKSEAFLKSK